MSTAPNENLPDQELVSDIQRRQRNTTWPDVMTNAASSDALMWRGSNRITKVQRVGVGLFGLCFVIAGAYFASNIYNGEGWMGLIFAVVFFLLGLKALSNSIRKNNPSKAPEDHR